MRPTLRPVLVCLPLLLGIGILLLAHVPPVRSAAAIKGAVGPGAWRVEDLRSGMKGIGRTTMKGTAVETFQVELLGILKNTSPGRDLILARLSGLNLEKTGVIAGMSGSPVYIDGKLVGAVAYAWPFGKEPIAGISPYVQMQSFAEAVERREAKVGREPVRIGLRQPILVGDKQHDAVTVSQDFGDDETKDGLWMMPLRTPLAATGFSRHSLNLLAAQTRRFGLVPMMGGAAQARIAEEEKNVKLEPGGPLALSLITGDFDLSGIGTVTHIEGNRVYGWGHPFMSLGACRLPMMTGYIHLVYPRQTVSFKMGSPLRAVGVINADVSTCIAGVLGEMPEMMPLRMVVVIGGNEERVFNVNLARHRTLQSSLVYAALTNSVDMEGELPEEMTARLHARIALENGETIEIRDTFSGFSGGRAPAVLYTQVSSAVSMLSSNPFKSLAVRRIDCSTQIEKGRSSAEIEAMELDASTYAPGDTVKAKVYVRPYRGERQRVTLSLKLPADLPDGEYTATAMDETSNARDEIRANPTLLYPSKVEQTLEGLRVLTAAKRTTMALRVPVGAHGVAANGTALPNLPGSMVKILANSKRTGAMTMNRALVAKEPTNWVIVSSDSAKFRVSRERIRSMVSE